MVDLALDFDKLANQIGGFGAEQVIQVKAEITADCSGSWTE